MQRAYCISGDRVVETPADQASVLVLINPDEAERRHLVDHYQLDEHTLQSALDPDEPARLEFEPEHVAMILKRPKNYSAREQLLFRASTMGAFLFRDLVIIVLAEDVPLFDGKTLIRVSSLQDVMLRLIYRSIYHFLEHLKIINALSEELEQKINRAMENRYLYNLFTLEKSLVYYLNAINSNGTLIEKLKLNAAKIGFNPEQLELIDDITIENNQCYRQAEIYSNILASLMDARASIVGNNLNVLMKTLNIITIAIMMPTLIVSIFSMNVVLPLGQQVPHSFWFILGLAAISAFGFLFFWTRRRW